jgi:hypothetical protein
MIRGSNHLYSATPLSWWLLQIMLRFMFGWEQHSLQPLGRDERRLASRNL